MCELKDGTAEISKICRSPKKNIFAVGYTDGYVRLWDIEKKEMKCNLLFTSCLMHSEIKRT